MTSDPEPGSSDFPLPPSVMPPSGPPSYGPPSYSQGGYQGPYRPPGGYGPFSQQGHYVQPEMRVASVDRERTTDVLKWAYAEGRLDQAEFDQRCTAAQTAKTYGDLQAVVADLPSWAGGPMMPAPYQQGYFSPAVPTRTNGMAIGSLVCGIVPFFGFLPGIVLGHVARGQIRRTGERGDGVAIAGLVLGYLWLAMWALVIVVSAARGGS